MSKEKVYGLEVNTYGDMAARARTLLRFHMCLLVLYLLSGPLEILGAVLSPVVTERKEQSELSSVSNRNPAIEVPFGLLTIGGAVLLLKMLYMGIKGDNKDLLTGTMFCDGCCAACNCLLGFCGFAGVITTFLLKAYFDSEDACACKTSIDLQDSRCIETCSVCFDAAKCRKEVSDFQNGFGAAFGFWTLWTIVVCLQMCICALTAVRLSWARNVMLQTPFCQAPPSVGADVVVGAPVRQHTYEHDL